MIVMTIVALQIHNTNLLMMVTLMNLMVIVMPMMSMVLVLIMKTPIAVTMVLYYNKVSTTIVMAMAGDSCSEKHPCRKDCLRSRSIWLSWLNEYTTLN